MTAPFYDESTVNSPMEELFLLSCYTLKHSLKKEEKKQEKKRKAHKNPHIVCSIYMKRTNRYDC